ncbi:MAG: hypothetical protein TECD_00437 [Hyphomicrobiaceae bacterium hypho_1]
MKQHIPVVSFDDCTVSCIRLPIALLYPGVVATYRPITTLVLFFLVSVLAGFSISKLKFDDSLRTLFNSKSTTFKEFERLSENFPQSNNKIILVVTANNFEHFETLKALQDFYFEILLSEGVSDAFSIFNIRAHSRFNDMFLPLIPEPLLVTSDTSLIMQEIRKHPLVQGRLLTRRSDDTSDMTIIMVSPDRGHSLASLIDHIRYIAKNFEKTHDMSVGLTGMPVIRIELSRHSSIDRVLFLSLGLVLGITVCLIFFRRLDFLIIANSPGVLCLYWSICAFGATGVEINPIITSVLPLLMVIAFTNTMHILFALRQQLLMDREVVLATLSSLRIVGPACIVSALTTTLAFISIAQTDVEIIRKFGLAAAAGAFLSYIAVIVVVPALIVILLSSQGASVKEGLAENKGLTLLDKIADKVVAIVISRAYSISAISLISLCLTVWLCTNLKPQYRLSDMMPTNGEAKLVAQDLASSLSGFNPVHVMMSWDGDYDIETLLSQVLPAIAEADALLRNNDLISNVWSLETLRSLLIDTDGLHKGQLSDLSVFTNAIQALPENSRKLFINIDNKVTLLTGFTADLEAKAMMALRETLEKDLSTIANYYNGISFKVTGEAILSAEGSLSIISQLYTSLVFAIVIVTVAMMIAFRSFAVGIFSFLPNLFAVTATGSTLYALGWELEYAGIMSLTVAFGLAVDDTTHVFNCYRKAFSEKQNISDNITKTLRSIGPVLILTTLVLFLGISGSIISEVPPTRLFGQVFMSTVIFALVGDLIMLPSLIFVAAKFGINLSR